MTSIELRYGIGEKVYFTKGSIIYEGKVISIEVFISEDESHNKFTYGVEYTSANFEDHKERTTALWLKSDELFHSFASCFAKKVREYEKKLKSNYDSNISKWKI